MNDVKVYVTKNKYERDFHVLFDDIVKQLYMHDCRVEIIHADVISPADFINIPLHDCEIFIDYDGKFKALSFMDYHSYLSDFFAAGLRNNNLARKEHDTLLVSQIKSPYTIWTDSYIETVPCKVLGGIYTPQLPFIDFELLRTKRQQLNKIDKFVFRGNITGLPRNVIQFLESSQYYSGTNTYGPMEYFENILQYKVGLCIPGAGEICHRDIEYMAMGIPMMKFEYMSNLVPPLIPDVHYISIPRIDEHPFEGERSGKQEYADLYLKRFLEVKDDLKFLEFVSNNAMEYYDKYLHPRTRVKHIFDLWELPFYAVE